MKPSLLLSAERLSDPKRLHRSRQWRVAVLLVLAVVSLAMGASQGDGSLVTLGVLCLVAGAPFTWWWYGWLIKAGEKRQRQQG